jgi:integrase
MATVRKRPGPKGKSVWQAQIIRTGYKRQYRTFDTKGEAEAWARRVEAEMDSGSWQDRSEGDRTTVAQALDRYELEIVRHKAPATQRQDKHRIRTIRKSLIGPIALSRLTGRDVADYTRHREKQGLGGSALRREISVLSHLFTVARSAWGMAYLVNPVPLARQAMPPVPSGRERRLKDGEEQALLEAASSDFAPVIRFALATAMRRGEIASLTWDQVDVPRRRLTLGSEQTKTRTSRSVPLSPAAIDVLTSLVVRRIKEPVFGMTAGAIGQAWRRTVKRAGIEGLTFHDLRHEAISRLFENTDLDIMEIRAITGHKTLQMLARYTHLRTHRLADRLAGKRR